MSKFKDSVAADCRYGDVAAKIWGEWDVIWMDAENNYQGHASFVVKSGRKYCFYEYWYGSCSGCDDWENRSLTDEEIEKEMRSTAMWLSSKKALLKWCDMLTGMPLSGYDAQQNTLGAGLDMLGGGLSDRINALRVHLGMSPLQKNPKATP